MKTNISGLKGQGIADRLGIGVLVCLSVEPLCIELRCQRLSKLLELLGIRSVPDHSGQLGHHLVLGDDNERREHSRASLAAA